MTAAEIVGTAAAYALPLYWLFGPRRDKPRRAPPPPVRTPAQQAADEIERRIGVVVIIWFSITVLLPAAFAALLVWAS